MDTMREFMMGLAKAPKATMDSGTLDATEILDNAAGVHLTQELRMHAASVISEWAETSDEDLDDGETLGDRLLTLLMAAVDEDGDEELNETEQEMLDAVLMAAEEYLAAHGVDDADITGLLDDWSEDAAVRARDAIAGTLPDGEEADRDLTDFAFDAEATTAVFDAVVRKMVSFKHGKKAVRSRRISGRPKKMSPKQRAALRKARSKSNSSRAKRWRAVSLKKRARAGLAGRSKRA